MFQNNLKIAVRQLLKNKFISFINLLGLVIGMTAALFIWQYVNYEKSYDNFHDYSEDVFRIRTDRVKDGVTFMKFAGGAAFAAPFMKNNFSEVEDYVKLKSSREAVYTYKDNAAFRERRAFFAMSSVFDIFSFPLLKGDPKTCLTDPFTVCLSESMAEKMFGSEDPMGKMIRRNDDLEYRVTGVFADCPENSHMKFEILLSYATYSNVFYNDGVTETSPYWDGYYSYLKLKPGTDWKALEARIPAAIEASYDADVRKQVELYLQPLRDIHLKSNLLGEFKTNGDDASVSFLFIIGIIILFVAWFNFINLATARSELRAREVGVRKVVGGSRGSLIRQFLTEAALMNVVAIAFSFMLVQLCGPLLKPLLGHSVSISIFSDIKLVAIVLTVFLVGTLLAGLYPAFLLSSYKPLRVLKSSHTDKGKGGFLRKGLVVVQFMAAAGLIACTLVVYSQLHYMQNTKLGVNIEQIMVVKGPTAMDSTFEERAETFKRELFKMPNMKKLAASSSVPGQGFGWTAGGVQLVGAPEDEAESFHVMEADAEYSQLYEMALVAGRHLSPEMIGDRSGVLLNEKGAALLKFDRPEDAVGRRLSFWGSEFTIVGVLKNFHQESPKAVVEPLVLRAKQPAQIPSFYSIKMSTQNLKQVIADLEGKWASVFPGNPFDYFFLDDHFHKQYAADERFGQIFSLFSGLAIFVSCLGLFALMAFMAERKKKEIGIRKVLGASVPGIVRMLSRDFLILMVLALLIAIPIVWYFMNGWLNNFANRIDIQWWIFVLAGLGSIGLALLTISFQSLKAAMADPVESLRNE
ncbi:MAG: ABC transporter permease [Bacteroidota bacterium]